MKKVLFITYYFPPRANVGSVRPGGLAKYLPRYGWDPVILTARLPEGPRPAVRIVETDYVDLAGRWKAKLGIPPDKSLGESPNRGGVLRGLAGSLLRPLVRAARSAILFPDAMRGWIPFALEGGRGLLRNEKFDAILVSCGPESGALVASRLAKEFKLPWMADLRDLWVRSHFSRGGPVRRLFESILERRTLAGAKALATVSDSWAEDLRRDYPGKPVFTIHSGYDPDDFNLPSPPLLPGLVITCTGHFDVGGHDVRPLLTALENMAGRHQAKIDRVRVRFFGKNWESVALEARRRGLQAFMEFPGPVPRDVSLRMQRESQALLLFGWRGASGAGLLTGRVFEYLGSRRPILLVGGRPGDLSRFLEETGAGRHASTQAEVELLFQEIIQEYGHKGFLSYKGREEALSRYTQDRMSMEFGRLLDGACAGFKESGGAA